MVSQARIVYTGNVYLRHSCSCPEVELVLSPIIALTTCVVT